MRHLKLAIAVALSVGGCAAVQPAMEPYEGPLLPSLQVYTAGEEVTFVLQVTNTTDSPLEVTFGSGQSFDFRVASDRGEVWRWSADQAFTQALRMERLEPGESRRYEAVWRPARGETGEFVATGVLTSSDHRVEQSTRIVLP